jgi:Na+/H+ antiporter NhaB
LASAGSSVLGALGSVAKALTSPAGITALAGAATAYFKYQGTVSTNQTQQAVLATQLQRAQAGQTAAPITYMTGANGQQIPVIATPNGQGGYTYAPLTSAGLANLTPASLSAFLSQYGLWLALGAGALLLLSRR